jgi:hypothetical protein
VLYSPTAPTASTTVPTRATRKLYFSSRPAWLTCLAARYPRALSCWVWNECPTKAYPFVPLAGQSSVEDPHERLGEHVDFQLTIHRMASTASSSPEPSLGGWLTTVVARVCLDVLRSRKSRRVLICFVVVTPPSFGEYSVVITNIPSGRAAAW